ncbi:thioesterase family protein [Allosaccharopolyspora coralli]|uniref:Thioesterase family protein n=1 Tax=Allosaccharopolyspora coralli TaxID=2665642 RepID=A0A5Q3Q6D0_9PSEU|nr:thioesterase family protein [Allosaccharopolyspora coralli]QGK70158.1 thioesterase family protein [Allosaccharopolyspora coralli]
MDEAFYEHRGGDHFVSTTSTAGPWSPDSQHFGPPAGLLARALESCRADGDVVLGRITVEILGPVPITDLWVSAEVDRPGKSVQLLTATLRTEERPVARASAWRLARSETASQHVGVEPPLAPVEDGVEFGRPDGWGPGYIDAMEWISLQGSLGEEGPATVWVRQRIPLVAGEEPTPLQRVMTVVDSASGVSSWLDPSKWLFINTELTVHLHRAPVGEWVGLDARTAIGPEGMGTALSTVHDQQGHTANSAQALLVRSR